MDPSLAAQRLVKAVQELSLARELDRVMAIVRTTAREITGADGATFVLRDGERCYYADEDAIAPLWKGQRFPMEACVSGWVMRHHEPVAIPDIYDDTRVPTDAYRPTFVKSLVMVPIRTAAPVGAIGTYWAEPHRTNSDEVELLSTLANATSMALENLELVRTQRNKEELAALIVHDLRSPASGIMLQSQVRMGRLGAEDRDRQNWQNVYASAEAIHRMAMNLLDVMRSESGTFQAKVAPVELPKLVAEITAQMAPLAAAHELALVVDDAGAAPVVSCDAELVRRVVQNLVDNAIRYSPEGGTVTLRLRGSELRVIDEGIGIPVDQRVAVFDKWKRLEAGAGRSASGRGLGLAFCKLAVEAHGGTIAIETHEPRGTEFVVRLAGSGLTG